MKRSMVVAIGVSILIVVAVAMRLFNSFRSFSPRASVSIIGAAEGTWEDPLARKRYEWFRLRDPATNTIPTGMAEQQFAEQLATSSQLQYPPLTGGWIARGPFNIGGRTRALAIDVTNENVILAGGVSGGMWKSTDGGQTWRKTTAPNQLHSVSCIAQNRARGREHIWYYGTGESYPRGGTAAHPNLSDAFYRGDGIFKSVDGGDHWTLLPATISNTPQANDAFDYVFSLATFGEDGIFAATSDGLFKSIDGGTTWERVLYFEDNYLNTEIAIASDGTCYATVAGAGPDNGVYRSEDGQTWEHISPSDWPNITMRTAIGMAPSNENIIYFFSCLDGLKTQLWKYEHGVGWTNLTANLPWAGDLITYGGHMMIVKVKPDDPNVLFLGTVGLYRSKDAGRSFQMIGAYSDFHVDQHAITFLPSNPKVIFVGNDGGVFKTLDNLAEPQLDPRSGEYHISWQSLNNGYLTTQFYSIAIDHATPGNETILGGTQDNAFLYTTSLDVRQPWEIIFGGAMDGGFTAIADGGDYFYATQAGSFAVWRFDFLTGALRWTEITPAGASAGTLWLPPFLLDAHDTKIMYLPLGDQLWRNSDLTQIPYKFPPAPTDVNWERLQHIAGSTITALAMSPGQPRRLYFATFGWSTGAKVFRLDDPHVGQPQPREITGKNFPYYPYSPSIGCIAVDPINPDKLLVAFPNYSIISIYASTDAGEHWTPVAGNLEQFPDGSGSGPSVRWLSILYVEGQPVVFAGTSIGLFSTVRLDSMDTVWRLEGAETIGNVVIDMIDVRQSDGLLVVGTHGNGVYSTHITQLPSEVKTIVSPPERFILYPASPNPFNESTNIRFALPTSGHATLKIYNLLGEEIITLLDEHLSDGIHTAQWTANHMPSGVYLIRLDFENWTKKQKAILLR